MRVRATAWWGALGLLAVGAAAWGLSPGGSPGPARAAAARLSLTAEPVPGGGVRLRWALTGADAAVTQLRVLRGLAPDALDRADDLTHPVARWAVPPAAAAAWIDAAPADGVAYAYRVEATTAAGRVKSPAVTIATPPRALPPLTRPAIAIDKAAYVLGVYEGERVVKRYAVALGGAPTRRKRQFDNASTPEGLYTIAHVQPRATYHRAYDLSYPNALDRVRHAVSGAAAPIGGEIQIHGRGRTPNWTFGCIALDDADIDELFTRPALRAGVPVRIWGGELTAADVEAMATPPDARTREAWARALASRGHAADAAWGPALWTAIGRFQRAEGLPLSCQPDAETARRLGLAGVAR